MSGNSYGTIFKVTTFGESHGNALGVVIDGVTPGIKMDESIIQYELDRRRPGQSAVTTPRREADSAEILSGVYEGLTTGAPLAILVRNSGQRSQDYDKIADIFRPGHADYTLMQKYGIRDPRGGGRSSGRETVGRVAAGAVAKELLKRYGVKIIAHTVSIGDVVARTFDEAQIERNAVRCADATAAETMVGKIKEAMAARDSVGGVVECIIHGAPTGLGEPVFDKLDAELAKAMLSLGGVKGIEFGSGFAATLLRGSQNNDPMTDAGFTSNNAGGILGGISNGEDIIFRIAVKPTASVGVKQHSINAAAEDVEIEVGGRHDPCLCPRMVVVVEAMAALVMIDMIKRQAALRA